MGEKKLADKTKKVATKATETKETDKVKDIASKEIISEEKATKSKNLVIPKIPKESTYGTGRRKSAIAKVWIYKGKGQVFINKQPALDYVGSEILSAQITKPLKKLSLESQYDCQITCLGGGIVGQVGACQLGIARALLLVSPEYRKPLKEEGMLTRDARVKERKKYGRKRARKGYQFRKR